ncbi:MAG: DUF2336 domain-containing protein [Rhodospirillales bacterium]|nr:DUF2336 domain-containing protein [Rhodospirillales bacterium]
MVNVTNTDPPPPVDKAYEDAKRRARDSDIERRRQLAAQSDLRPEILYFLAEDESPDVRRSVAANTATPYKADLLLVRDPDADVRADLAGKVARLLPGLPPDAQDGVRKRVMEIIEILARDEATRVRGMIAEALKDVVSAPPDIIRQLARDLELVVARPVLRFSPLLTDDDLLDIIAGRHALGALPVIAGRQGLAEPVADAIVATEDTAAVSALLANPSAQIREETLDLIADRAPGRVEWHAPLVDRPSLPSRIARRIAAFIAESLLRRLERRPDLDAETSAALAKEVRRRLDADEDESGGPAAESPAAKAQRLQAEGRLDEEVLSEALASGEVGFVKASLGLLSGLTGEIVDKILSARSAKGVTALAWKAGLSMHVATQIQMRLGGISPRQALKSRAGTQDYPLPPEEMTWHLEFFGA